VTYCVQQRSSSVITNSIPQAIVNPSFDSVTIVETSNGRRNESTKTDMLSLRKASLIEPHLVELNLLGSIAISGIVKLFMGESVSEVSKKVTVGGVLPPDQQWVILSTSNRVSVCGWCGWPDAGSSA
jgi:hypothetical protein